MQCAKLAHEIPDDSGNSFVFLHQRVNHTPYTGNCAPAPKGLYIFNAETGSAGDQRRAAYDNGLRCWDRDTAALVEPFLKRPGAVQSETSTESMPATFLPFTEPRSGLCQNCCCEIDVSAHAEST